jgi:hypothetical protein
VLERKILYFEIKSYHLSNARNPVQLSRDVAVITFSPDESGIPKLFRQCNSLAYTVSELRGMGLHLVGVVEGVVATVEAVLG